MQLMRILKVFSGRFDLEEIMQELDREFGLDPEAGDVFGAVLGVVVLIVLLVAACLLAGGLGGISGVDL
jgi:hypothetical protein